MITPSIAQLLGLAALAMTPLLLILLWGIRRLRAANATPSTPVVADSHACPEMERLPEGIWVVDPRQRSEHRG